MRCARARASWIPWRLSFHFILFHDNKTPNDAVTPQHQSQFTPKMKENVILHLLSSLVWINQYNECNRMTSLMEFMHCTQDLYKPHFDLHIYVILTWYDLSPSISDLTHSPNKTSSQPDMDTTAISQDFTVYLTTSGTIGTSHSNEVLTPILKIWYFDTEMYHTQWRCELAPYSQWAHLSLSPWG